MPKNYRYRCRINVPTSLSAFSASFIIRRCREKSYRQPVDLEGRRAGSETLTPDWVGGPYPVFQALDRLALEAYTQMTLLCITVIRETIPGPDSTDT